MQSALAEAVVRAGVEPIYLPSGAGHDAEMFASVTDIGMLFVRCGNGGISHHPDESLGADDAEIAARAFQDFVLHFERAP